MPPPAETSPLSPLQAALRGADRALVVIAPLPRGQQQVALQRALAQFIEKNFPEANPAEVLHAFSSGVLAALPERMTAPWRAGAPEQREMRG